jgi:hypothetical protein
VVRAILDANIYISAAIRPAGPPGRIIERLLRDAAFEVVLSPGIANEILRAFSYPKVRRHLDSKFQPEQWLEEIMLVALLVPGEYQLSGVSKDSDDDKYIAAAIEGRADFIVAGDSDLLNLKMYQGIRIVNPREFLSLLID